jgi:hypothetical protein
MSTRKIPGSKAGRCVRLTTYHLLVPNVKKIRGLNLPGPHGPVQACSETALLYRLSHLTRPCNIGQSCRWLEWMNEWMNQYENAFGMVLTRKFIENVYLNSSVFWDVTKRKLVLNQPTLCNIPEDGRIKEICNYSERDLSHCHTMEHKSHTQCPVI